jgi:hypothetical protein
MKSGRPAGSTPTVLNPIWASGVADNATIDAATTNSAIGRAGSSLSPTISNAIAQIPKARTTGWVSGS